LEAASGSAPPGRGGPCRSPLSPEGRGARSPPRRRAHLAQGGIGMRIAQIAPLYESVPPQLYGGTERVVSYLTEELVRQGHQVTLFASGDSQTRAELIPGCAQALPLARGVDPLAHHIRMLERVFHHAHRADILHFY